MKWLPVLTLLAALCAASSASAQVIVSGNYYEEEKAVTCSIASTSCHAVFTATPQNVLVTDVSCMVGANAGVYQAYIAVSDTASAILTRRNTFFPLAQMSINGSTTFYATTFQTNFLFGSGKWPTITIAAVSSTTYVLDCKIVGTLQ